MSIKTFYKFGSDATDIVGGYNGTVTGATLSKNSMYGSNGYTFDGGSGKYIQTAYTNSLWNGVGTMSLEVLVYLTSALSTTSASIIHSGNGGWWLGSYTALSGNNGFGINTGSWTFCNASSVFPTNKRVHIVGTYDGSNLRIYVDGALSNTTAKTGNISQGTSGDYHGYIGYSTSIGTSGPVGDITFIKAYSETLSAGQIKNKSAYYKGFI